MKNPFLLLLLPLLGASSLALASSSASATGPDRGPAPKEAQYLLIHLFSAFRHNPNRSGVVPGSLFFWRSLGFADSRALHASHSSATSCSVRPRNSINFSLKIHPAASRPSRLAIGYRHKHIQRTADRRPPAERGHQAGRKRLTELKGSWFAGMARENRFNQPFSPILGLEYHGS